MDASLSDSLLADSVPLDADWPSTEEEEEEECHWALLADRADDDEDDEAGQTLSVSKHMPDLGDDIDDDSEEEGCAAGKAELEDLIVTKDVIGMLEDLIVTKDVIGMPALGSEAATPLSKPVAQPRPKRKPPVSPLDETISCCCIPPMPLRPCPKAD